jgi:hypothetical protein
VAAQTNRTHCLWSRASCRRDWHQHGSKPRSPHALARWRLRAPPPHQVTRAEPTIEPVGIAQASRKLAQPIADTILDQRQAFLTPGLEEKMAQLPNVAQFGEQETTFATSLEEVFRNEDGDGVTLQEGAVLTSGGARFRSPGGEITRRSVRNPPSRTGMSDSCRRLAAYAAQAEIIGPSGRIFEPGCLCREARPAHKRAFAAQLAINAGPSWA